MPQFIGFPPTPVIAFVYLSDVDRPTVCHCVPKKVTT